MIHFSRHFTNVKVQNMYCGFYSLYNLSYFKKTTEFVFNVDKYIHSKSSIVASGHKVLFLILY